MSVSTQAAPSTVDELLNQSGPVVLEIAGAGRSAFNGQVVATEGAILGLAHWDGTLYLDRECILDPLEQMYSHAGEKQPVPTLLHYREALATLLHEHAHFLGASGASQDAAREAFLKPGSRELEEGVAEAWAHDNLNEYLTRLGVDEVAPGIKEVETAGHYNAFVPAVRRITSDLEARNELDPGQVLDALNRETAAGQFPLLVSLIYNSSRLPELEPVGATTRDGLESLLRQGLNHLDTYEGHPPGFAAAKSHSTATDLLKAVHQHIQSAESSYTSDPSACALPAPTPTPVQTALSGVSPLRLVVPSVRAAAPAHDQRLAGGGFRIGRDAG